MSKCALDRGCMGDDNSLCTIDCAAMSLDLISLIVRSCAIIGQGILGETEQSNPEPVNVMQLVGFY
jgi:hypothetical protein